MSALLFACHLLLAGVFLVSGLAKLADREAVRDAAAQLGVSTRLAGPVARLLGPLELTLAAALLVPATATAAAWAAAALLAALLAVAARPVLTGRQVECHCFGALNRSAIGWPTLARNAALLAVAALAASNPAAGPLPPWSWLGDLDGLTLAALTGAVTFGAVAAGLGLLVVRLLRRNGALLLRIDDLEDGRPPDPTGAAAPGGLPVGTPAPDFRLPGLDGREVTLPAALEAGLPVLITFTDPGCGPCTALLPDLARWHTELAGRCTFLTVSGGSPDTTRHALREHPLGTVAIDASAATLARYRAPGTPSAVLVTPTGRIGSPLAAGTPAIRALISSVQRPEPATPTAAAAFTGPHLREPVPAVPLRDLPESLGGHVIV